MSEFFDHVTPELAGFIRAQLVFFVATAAPEGRINLSPKGMDTFRVLDRNRVGYLDLTGSGNETAAHLLRDGRITIMFCSFDKNAEIARIYGRGSAIRPDHSRWPELIVNFPKLPGVRQVMEIRVESAMTSCGYAVPRMRDLTRATPSRSTGSSAVKLRRRITGRLTISAASMACQPACLTHHERAAEARIT